MWKSVSWYTNGIQPADGFLEVEYSAVRALCPANTSAVNWAIKTYSLRPLVESRLRIHIIPIVLLRSSTHWLDLLTSIDYFGNLLINSRLETHGILVSQPPIFVRPCTLRPHRSDDESDVTAQIFPDCRPNNRVWAQTHLEVKAKRTPKNVGGFPNQCWGFSKTHQFLGVFQNQLGFLAGFLARRSVGDRVETSSNAMSGEFWDGLP